MATAARSGYCIGNVTVDFFQVISDRRSIRKYLDIPVEMEKVEQILEAARLAPSSHNMQCWRFLILTSKSKKESVVSAFSDSNPGKKSLNQAPLILVICADPKDSVITHGIEYYLVDAGIAFEHICLAAHALGLGTCMMGWLDEERLKTVLDIPAEYRVIGVTPLGYPDQEPKPRPRKKLSEITYLENWGAIFCR